MIKHYLILALRQLKKDKIRTLVSILGITAGLLCFSVCNYYFRTMSAGNSVLDTYNRLAELKLDKYTVGLPMDYWQKIGMEEFEEVAFYTNTTMNVTLNESTLCRTKATRCNGGYFKVFPAKCAAGALQRFEVGQDVVVVTTNFVRNFCANTNPLEQTLQLPDGKKMSIIAVIEPYPAGMNSYPTVYDIFVPYDNKENIFGENKLLLHRPEDAARITQRLSRMTLNPDRPDDHYSIELDSEAEYRAGDELWIGAIGLLVLMVGLINFYSLNINSFLSRTRELSMRYTLGGRKRDLFTMLYLEQSILLLVSTLVALVVSEAVLPLLTSSLPTEAREELAINTGRLCFYELQYFVGLLLISALVVVLTVSFAQRKTLIRGMKGVGKSGRSKHVVRNVSLGLQLFFSLFFIISTVAVWLQMQGLSEKANSEMSKEDKQAVISVSISGYSGLKDNLESIKHKITACPWYSDMAITATNYLSSGNTIEVVLASDSYFDIMHLDKNHKVGEPFCYINSTLHDEMANDSIPNIFTYFEQEYPVKGITTISAPRGGIKRVAIIPLQDVKDLSHLFVRIRSDADKSQVQKDMETILNPYLPVNDPWKFTTLYDEQCNMAVNIMMWLFVVCSIICLLITVLGIYGAITIDTDKRQKEVAIRKINGATLRNIYWLFGRTYVFIYVVAAVCTVSISLFGMIMGKQMQVLLIDYTLPILWIFPLFISALIMALTISWRIYKITTTNPAEVITNE